MNEQQIIRKAMSALGKRKSRKKAAAARRNGRKGGRPRKQKQGEYLNGGKTA